MHAIEEAVDATFSDARSQAIGHQRLLKRRLPMFLMSVLDGAARVRVASKAPGMLASETREHIFPSITKKPLEDDNLAGTICGARKESSFRTWASFALAASIFIWPAVAMTV